MLHIYNPSLQFLFECIKNVKGIILAFTFLKKNISLIKVKCNNINLAELCKFCPERCTVYRNIGTDGM